MIINRVTYCLCGPTSFRKRRTTRKEGGFLCESHMYTHLRTIRYTRSYRWHNLSIMSILTQRDLYYLNWQHFKQPHSIQSRVFLNFNFLSPELDVLFRFRTVLLLYMCMRGGFWDIDVFILGCTRLVQMNVLDDELSIQLSIPSCVAWG